MFCCISWVLLLLLFLLLLLLLWWVGACVPVMAKKGMPVLSKLLANAQEKNG